MWSNHCDMCPWPAFRKVNQLFSDMQDVIRFSLLSVPWQMIWLVEEASQWALIGFWIPFVFWGKIHWAVALWEGFLKRIFVAVFLWIRLQGTFLIADFAANCVKVLNAPFHKYPTGPLGCLVPGAKGDDPRQALPMFSGSSCADWVVPSILKDFTAQPLTSPWIQTQI